MLNNVSLIGRLTRDIELKYTQSGIPVVSVGLAVDRPKGKDQAEAETDFIDLVAWRQTAELMNKYLGKGRLVGIEGRIQTRTYEGADGQKRKAVEVNVNQIHFLDKPKESGSSTEAAQQQKQAAYNAGLLGSGDDVPF